jgi:hypothetical protein
LDSSHWRRDGQPKVSYGSRGEALGAADEQIALSGARLTVYQCPFCSGWHMGGRSLDPVD